MAVQPGERAASNLGGSLAETAPDEVEWAETPVVAELPPSALQALDVSVPQVEAARKVQQSKLAGAIPLWDFRWAESAEARMFPEDW